MNANIETASRGPTQAASGSDKGSTPARLLRALRSDRTGDIVTGILWAAFALYGLAATINVIVTY